MLVKDAMTRTSIKFFENDYIEETARMVLNTGLKGGLVYNIQDALRGYFSSEDLLAGFVQGKRQLAELTRTDFHFVDEMQELKTVKFADEVLLPVMNKHCEVTGFLSKEQYLLAYAKVTQVELSRLDAIFNSAHNGILSIDRHGKITSINPPAERMALTTKEKAIGKFLTDVVTPSGLLNVVRTGKGHTEKYQVGNRMYLTHRQPIFDGEEVVGAVGVFQDISELEFMSNELDSVKQILNELDTILNHSSDGICITDQHGNVIKSNERFQELFREKSHSHHDQQTSEKPNTAENRPLGENQPPNQTRSPRENQHPERKSSNNQRPTPPSLPSLLEKMVKQAASEGRPCNVMETNKFNRNSLIISAIPIKNSKNGIERIVINVKDMTEMDELRHELEKTKSILEHMHQAENADSFIAISSKMKRLMETVVQVAKVDVTVLLTGESGVGKEEIAKLIQESSPRADQPFIKVNCGAIPESLIESELFGYEGGAFTGALKKGKPGLFEQANNGTLFLDEVGEIPLHLQVKLLRVLQEMEITRVGATLPVKVDVRVIAATNQDLQELVKEGSFREDLFYRLNVIPIPIPPLRQRMEDIPLLIDAYAKKFASKYNRQLRFSKEAIHVLTGYHWPGNVRELVNILERLYVTTPTADVREEDILEVLGDRHQRAAGQKAIVVNEILPLRIAVEELERALILKASQTEKSYRGIARVLEVNASTIVRKVKKLEGGHPRS